MDAAAFLFVYLLLGVNRRTNGELRPTVVDLVENPAALAAERAWFEPWLRTEGARSVEFIRQMLLGTLRYLSGLDGGPIPVPLPRGELLELAAAGQAGDNAALAVARSLQRFVRSQAAAAQQPRDEQFMDRLEEIVARVGGGGMPRNQRYMNTEQIAKWLGLAVKTVRRLFTEGKLVGRKVGNEWRATREQLEQSPYLRQRRRRGDAALE
jgi:excisionase family DNA binding protein